MRTLATLGNGAAALTAFALALLYLPVETAAVYGLVIWSGYIVLAALRYVEPPFDPPP